MEEIASSHEPKGVSGPLYTSLNPLYSHPLHSTDHILTTASLPYSDKDTQVIDIIVLRRRITGIMRNSAGLFIVIQWFRGDEGS